MLVSLEPKYEVTIYALNVSVNYVLQELRDKNINI